MKASSSTAFLASSSVSGPGIVTAKCFSRARLPGRLATMPWIAISGMTTSRTGAPSQAPTMQAVSMNWLIRLTLRTPSPGSLTVNVRGETATTAYGSIMVVSFVPEEVWLVGRGPSGSEPPGQNCRVSS